jgi:type I restriction enzyme S subunit
MRGGRLKDIAEITMGQSPKAAYVSVEEIGLPLLNGPAEFTDRYPIPVQFTSERIRIAQANDILFCVRGSTTGRINIADQKYAVGRGLASIRHKSDSKLNSYIKALIEVNLKKLLGGTLGSVFPNITKDNLFELECYIHNETDQQKIASVLSALDDKIELNNRINSELEQMAKLLYEYWFVQFDFPYDFASTPLSTGSQGKHADETSRPQDIKPYKSAGGKMVWNKDLNREIPEGWGSGVASNLFDFNPSLGIPKGAGAKYLDMHSIPQSGFMTLEPQIKEFTGGVKFQNGDVVVARITPCLENGKTALITQLEENEIGFGSTEFIVIRGKSSQLSGFASFLARSESFRNFAISNMTGTSGRKRVDANTLKNYSLPIPDDMILSKFEGITAEIFNTQTNNVKQNQELSSLRDWLLPMLMNGQISVMDAEERVSEELGMVAEGERGKYEKK